MDKSTFVNGHENNITRRVYKVVLTGGPCGGKTTGQSRLCTFFENLGWKVYRAPETASILLGGGVKFADLSEDQTLDFQESLLKTMIEIENTYFRLADGCPNNCLIICDRGTMDPAAFVSATKWEQIMQRCSLNSVELRDTRYHQIIHMVSAANGAEAFYSTEDHSCRSEGLGLARELDNRAAQAWVGHPYFDVIDNSSDFDTKIRRMINVVCQKMGIDTGDRLETGARKLKFLVKGPLPPDGVFPPFEDFSVEHIYLRTNTRKMQARLRKRGKQNYYSYTHTIRKPEKLGQIVEVKTAIGQRDWTNMQSQADDHHFPIYKRRRCFLHNNQYFQLDIYREPCHPRCKGLILLETYSTMDLEELSKRLPSFLNIVDDVTGRPDYSMFNLSLKDEWSNSKKFCHSIAVEAATEVSDDEEEEEESDDDGVLNLHKVSMGALLPSQDSTIHLCPHISLPSPDVILEGAKEPLNYFNSADNVRRLSVPGKESIDALRRISCPVTKAPVIEEVNHH